MVNGRNGFHHARLGPGRSGLQALDLARRLDHLDRTHGGAGVAPNHPRQHIAQQAVIGHGPKVQIQTQAGLGQARTFQQAGQLAKGRAGVKHRWSRKTFRPLRLSAADQHRRRFAAIGPGPDIGGFHPVVVRPHMGVAQGLPGRRCKQLGGHHLDGSAGVGWHHGQTSPGAPEKSRHPSRCPTGPGVAFGLGQHDGVQPALAHQALGPGAVDMAHGLAAITKPRWATKWRCQGQQSIWPPPP